jgi:hypothetical protein
MPAKVLISFQFTGTITSTKIGFWEGGRLVGEGAVVGAVVGGTWEVEESSAVGTAGGEVAVLCGLAAGVRLGSCVGVTAAITVAAGRVSTGKVGIGVTDVGIHRARVSWMRGQFNNPMANTTNTAIAVRP